MSKKILSVLLALSFIISMSACSKADINVSQDSTTSSEVSQVENSANSDSSKTPVSSEQTDNEITITDQADRTIVISKEVENIAVCWYMANDFVLAMDEGDKLVAIGPHDDFQIMALPTIPEMNTVGRGRPDMEKMAALNPDLFIHTVGDKDNIEAVEALGIPMIQIDPETIADTLEAYHLVGKAVGNPERAVMLEEYYNNIIEKANNITKDVKQDDKLNFVILGKELGKVAHGNMIQSEMIVNGGGINLAADVQADSFWPEAGVEQIFSWNPDIIFISQTADYDVEDIVNDPAWSDLDAVKNGSVYKIPSSLHNWENPGMGTALATLWAADKMYPGTLDQTEFDQIVTDFYKDIYNLTIEKEALGY